MEVNIALQEEKLATLAEQWGMTEDQFVQVYALDSVVPGICMADDCDYSTGVEPDQWEGWCESCEAQTVTSGLILAGIV